MRLADLIESTLPTWPPLGVSLQTLQALRGAASARVGAGAGSGLESPAAGQGAPHAFGAAVAALGLAAAARKPCRAPKAALAATALAPEATFAVGDAVEVFGLESAMGKAMNGQRGVVTQWMQDKGRFQVKLSDGKTPNLKASNLMKVGTKVPAAASQSGTIAELTPLGEGKAVEIIGLKSGMGKVMNGQRGVITKWMPAKGRYQIQMFNGHTINLKPSNLTSPDVTAGAGAAAPAGAVSQCICVPDTHFAWEALTCKGPRGNADKGSPVEYSLPLYNHNTVSVGSWACTEGGFPGSSAVSKKDLPRCAFRVDIASIVQVRFDLPDP